MWTALRRRLAPVPAARVGRLPAAPVLRPAVSENLVRRPAVGAIRCPPLAPAGTSQLTVAIPPAEVCAWDVAGPLLRELLKPRRFAAHQPPPEPESKPEPFEAVSRFFVDQLGFTPSHRRLPADWFPPGVALGVKAAELFAARDHVPLLRVRAAAERYTRWDADRVVRAALARAPTAVVLLGNAAGTRAAVASAACVRGEWGHVLRRVPPRADPSRVSWLRDYGDPLRADGWGATPHWREGDTGRGRLVAATLFTGTRVWATTMPADDTRAALEALAGCPATEWSAELVAVRNSLVIGHLRLCRWVIRRHAFLSARRCLTLDDLMHEAVTGLVRAAERFDPTRGTAFTTYAYPWVRNRLQLAVANGGRLIRIPIHRFQKGQRLTRDEAARLTHFATLPRGRHEPACREESADGGLAHGSDELRDVVHGGLRFLKDREREVVIRRFGLDGEGVRSLQEIGDDFGVSKERIRQIQVRALKRLRTVAELQQLHDSL